MAKKQTAAQDDSTAAQLDGANQADQEVQGSQAALAEAADMAEQSVQAGDAGEGSHKIERPRLSREEQRNLSRKIARRQRELGSAELEKQYPNTIVVPATISIGDANIASSASRFLGLTDRTIYLLNRYGPRYMGAADLLQIRDSLGKMIADYVQESEQAFAQGQELVGKHKTAADGVWFEPQYTTHIMDTQFGVKARQTMGVVQALHRWDQAILSFAALNFNGCGDDDQIDTLRQRERSLFMAINKMCIRTINAMGRRAQEMSKASKAKAGGEPADVASGDTNQAEVALAAA